MGPKEKTLNLVYDRIRKHAALREYFHHLIETEGGVKASLKSVEIDPYQALAIAVVQKAAEDYRGARRALDLSEQYGLTPPPEVKKTLFEVERFFNSGYGDTLCFGKADIIWKRLKKEFVRGGKNA